MKKIAIITARGGSKRIPNKNIKTFCGKPIISHVIKIAINSKLFDEVMVSTDSEKIAEISRVNGASVPFMRSKNNSDDYSTTPDVLFEVLKEYKKNGIKFDIACCIYPTAVLIEKSILKRSLDLLKKNNFDTVFPYARYGHPIQRALLIKGDKIKMKNPKNYRKRTQDMSNYFYDTGQFYWFKVENFLIKKKLWTNNTGGIELLNTDFQDIDNEEDWELAELKYKYKYINRKNEF